LTRKYRMHIQEAPPAYNITFLRRHWRSLVAKRDIEEVYSSDTSNRLSLTTRQLHCLNSLRRQEYVNVFRNIRVTILIVDVEENIGYNHVIKSLYSWYVILIKDINLLYLIKKSAIPFLEGRDHTHGNVW